jgi:hypothetical protein
MMLKCLPIGWQAQLDHAVKFCSGQLDLRMKLHDLSVCHLRQLPSTIDLPIIVNPSRTTNSTGLDIPFDPRKARCHHGMPLFEKAYHAEFNFFSMATWKVSMILKRGRRICATIYSAWIC